MSSYELFDQRIFSTLETVLDYFCAQLPRYNSEFYPEDAVDEAKAELTHKPLYKTYLQKLQEQGYDEKTSLTFLEAGYAVLFEAEALKKIQSLGHNHKTSEAFFKACAGYLCRLGLLNRPHYHLSSKLTEDTKMDLCRGIFSEYEKYIKANHECSLRESEAQIVPPEKSPDSSSGGRRYVPSYGGK